MFVEPAGNHISVSSLQSHKRITIEKKNGKLHGTPSDTNKPLVCYRRKATDHQQILCIKVLTKWKSKTQKGNRKILLTFPY